MKTGKIIISVIGLTAAVAAFFLYRKRAQAAALPDAGVLPDTQVPEVSVPELTLTSEAVAKAEDLPLPGRTAESTIEQSIRVPDAQAAIAAWVQRSTQTAQQRLATETPIQRANDAVAAIRDRPLEISPEARARLASAAAPVAALPNDSTEQKKRREAYRGVIRAAATLLAKAGVSGSGCGILDANKALNLDPFGVSVDSMAGTVDTIEQKVSKVISIQRNDATFRTIAAMTDPTAICFALTVQLSTAAADVTTANARVTARPSTTAPLIGLKIAEALRVSCQGATTPSAAQRSSNIIFDAGKNPLSSGLSSRPSLKTGFA